MPAAEPALAVTVLDRLREVTVSPSAVTVAGAGGTANYTVVLDERPTGDVTITLASTDTNAATVSPAPLTFTTGNWDTARTVTVTGVSGTNDNPDNQRMARITHAAAGGEYDDAMIDDVTVTVTDDKVIERRDAELVLAGTARTMASDAVDVLAGRFDAPSAGGTQVTLAGQMLRRIPQGAQEAGAGAWRGTPALASGNPVHAERQRPACACSARRARGR